MTLEKEMKLIREIAQAVKEIGGTMYFVGGFVRDRLIGKASKDIDVEIHGITEAQVVAVLSTFGFVDKIGASFGVYLIKGVDIDFALPRTEIKTGDLHTDFDVTVDPFIGTVGASRRRDFTMNALMEDVLTGELIDHFGGREDISNRVIRLVDEETFKEDALRVLRAVQFSARFGFEIEFHTRNVMADMDLHHLAKERVYEEIRKGMTKGSPKDFVKGLKLFPNIKALMPSVKQIHAEYTVPGQEFPINVAMMGLSLPEEGFKQLLVDFVQQKQERKTAIACKKFLFDMMTCESTERAMATLISKHQAFLKQEANGVEILFLTERFIEEDTSELFVRVDEKRRACPLQVDGRWLIANGLNPSPAFASQLHQAEVMAWLGAESEEIIKTVVGEKMIVN